jgi:hypothetical protein
MRVIDGREIPAVVVDLTVDLEELAVVDAVAIGAVLSVRRPPDTDDLAVLRGDDAAALVRHIGLRMLDDLIRVVSGQPKNAVA